MSWGPSGERPFPWEGEDNIHESSEYSHNYRNPQRVVNSSSSVDAIPWFREIGASRKLGGGANDLRSGILGYTDTGLMVIF
jgi:hypothetical protein